MWRSCVAAAILLGQALPAAAQGLTDEEIQSRLDQQRAMLQLGASRSLGEPRGFTYKPVDETSPPAPAADLGAAAEAAPSDAPPATAEAAGTVVATVADPAAEAPVSGPAAPGLGVYVAFENEVTVDISIDFAFDSAAIAADQLPQLEQMCRVIKNDSGNLFRVVGHTDAAGSDDYNERLSVLRAQEVVRYLTGPCGIPASRLQAQGVGERFPADPADPMAAQNRRVEFQALS